MAIRCALALAAILLPAAIFSVPAQAASSADLTAAIKNMPAQSDKLRALMSNLSVSQFHFVNAGGEVDAATLHKNAAAIADLRDTLSHATLTDNDGVVTTMKKVLVSKNLTLDQIVAIYVGGTQITVFYQ
ncbi:MAG TPA: hypothetical protein VFO29_10560 [Candidatus Rubrimentiphilum sp.]|nr:hypothetical protein [Candidatus Rubrimentiphilum sp.]